mmetsp:Transcript_2019/g.2842  ORF Transcript_2019/g.2842 Transcript_2019/m.2842 type:complete len:576 (+) Transcript_2019:179-1906(+)
MEGDPLKKGQARLSFYNYDAIGDSTLIPPASVPSCYNNETFKQFVDIEATSFSEKDEDEEDDGLTYRLYTQRYFVLLAFSLVTLMNGWIWITASPLVSLLAEYWNVPVSNVNNLSSVYLYAYIPFAGPALFLLRKYHLRFGLLSGAALNFIGSVIRLYGMRSYFVVYLGQLFCALAQTFTLALPPLLAGTWFGPDERATATSLGVIANQIGSAFGLGMTAFVQFEKSPNILNEEALNWYVILQMVLSLIALVMVMFWVEDRPLTPPSEAAAIAEWKKLQRTDSSAMALYGRGGRKISKSPSPLNSIPSSPQLSLGPSRSRSTSPNVKRSLNRINSLLRKNFERNYRKTLGLKLSGLNLDRIDPFHTLEFGESIRFFFRNSSGLWLTVAYGLTVGVFYSLATYLSQFVIPDFNGVEWSEGEAGYLGVIFIIVGLLGSLISGYILDKSHAFRGVSIALLVGCSLSQLLFLAFVRYKIVTAWLTKVATYISVSLLGIFLTGFISTGFEYGTAISYPADEGIVAGILNLAAQIGGWVLIIFGQGVKEVGWVLNFILLTSLLVSLAAVHFGVTATSRRPI